jgi:hypothetical protein
LMTSLLLFWFSRQNKMIASFGFGREWVFACSGGRRRERWLSVAEDAGQLCRHQQGKWTTTRAADGAATHGSEQAQVFGKGRKVKCRC